MRKWLKRLYLALRYQDGLSVAVNASHIVRRWGTWQASAGFYQDERIRIEQVANLIQKIRIDLSMGGGEWRTVLIGWQTRIGTGIDRFEPGDWCSYVTALGRQASKEMNAQGPKRDRPFE